MGRKALALDWDAQSLRAVEGAVGKNALKISRVVAVNIPADVPPEDPAAFGAFVRRVLAEKRFGTRQALLAVPRDKALLVNLRLPKAPVGDLSAMVKLQAARELPFAVEEAVMDFAASEATDAPEFYDVTVGAVQRAALDYYRQLAQAAGLHIVRVGLRPNSNMLSVTAGVQPFADERILFVDIGPRTTEINIFRWGRVVFSRSTNVPVEVDGQVDDAAGRPLLVEVLRTVEAYRASDPAKIDQVIVAGDTGMENWLTGALRTRFQAPTSLYDARWSVAVDAAQAEQMTGFSAALGLLVGQISPEIRRLSFNSPKRPVDKAAVRRQQAILGGTAAAVALAIVWVATSMYVGRLTEDRNRLNAEIAQLRKQVESMQRLQAQVQAAQAWMREEVVWLERLKEIVALLPDNQQAYATKMTLLASPRSQEVQLSMETSDSVVPNDLASRLNELGTYKVRLGGGRVKPNDSKYGWTVDNVTIVMDPTKKAKAAAAPATRPASAQSPMAGSTGNPQPQRAEGVRG